MNKFMSVIILLFVFMIQLVIAQEKNDQGVSSQVEITNLGFSKVVNLTYEQAMIKVKQELKKEGFGILTEIDVQATMKKKLDVDYKAYTILGACNPALANQALQAEPQIGLMLPCKFIVYVDENDQTVVAAVDPEKMMQGMENKELSIVAAKVREKFQNVIKTL